MEEENGSGNGHIWRALAGALLGGTIAGKYMNEKRKRDNDLIGSAGCNKSQGKACNLSCPLWHDCSRGYNY